ncbi:hypothetical protein [Glutamicibacter protophormiae]|uniref:DUF1963 domain-containing protein n=1 Tax=Glutamicibacter protophormiae TaxID=37930 RepID=A0ABS4XUS3_GLUPR|nr:hypothetical protein [Glutamicibacter protophormiae]MBP2399478.1 hypothetical protein [Glutamicibacter protophormiae]GGL84527.1 hypothetical protein GCM10010038_13130 [Glutamicibacter protophormiae]
MKRTVGKGHFELELPADWSLKETGDYAEGQIYEDIKSSYSIRNAKGAQMAVLGTGIEFYWHGEPPMTQVHNEIVDFSDKAINGQSYVFATSEDSTGTSISLSMASKEQLAEADALPWVFNPTQSSAATFYRVIEDDEQLAGVDPSLTEIARAKAYAKTPEYRQLKSVMLSMREIKKFTAPPLGEASTAPASCVGAKYSYDLGNSQLSCDEAKAFLQRLLQERPSTGGVEIMGVGACMLAWEDAPGFCLVESTGGRFDFSVR